MLAFLPPCLLCWIMFQGKHTLMFIILGVLGSISTRTQEGFCSYNGCADPQYFTLSLPPIKQKLPSLSALHLVGGWPGSWKAEMTHSSFQQFNYPGISSRDTTIRALLRPLTPPNQKLCFTVVHFCLCEDINGSIQNKSRFLFSLEQCNVIMSRVHQYQVHLESGSLWFHLCL